MNCKEVIKCDDLYFDDGNIILAASTLVDADRDIALKPEIESGNHPSSKQKKVVCYLFRVHKSTLSTHATAFRDMFALPSLPESGGEKDWDTADKLYNGAPLVSMPDDALDLRGFLMALYDPSYLILQRLRRDTVEKIRGVLVLAKKYQADKLYNNLVDFIQKDWPRTLDEWREVEEEIEAIKTRLAREAKLKGNGGSSSNLDNLLPEPASVIRLARELDIPSLLPAAFYHLSRLNPSHDFDNARWSLLEREDLICLLHGKGNLAASINLTNAQMRDTSCFSCRKLAWTECKADEDILRHLQKISNERTSCIQTSNHFFCTKIEHIQYEVWKNLQEFFQLNIRQEYSGNT